MGSRRTRSSARVAAAAVSTKTIKPAPLAAAPKPARKSAAAAAAAAADSPSPAPSTTSSPSSAALPTLPFASAAAFDAWLAAQPPSSPGLWLRIAKKAAGAGPSVTYDQALDAALCHGWIDGQRRALDARHFLQRFTPRRRGSAWSRRNVDKVTALAAEGRLRGRGQAEVDAAKADGRWERAYAGSSTIQVSPEFQAALERNAAAERFFAELSKTQRYPFLLRLETAKRPETKARLIEQYVTMLAEGKEL